MNAEQRILGWLERADFDGTGCRHSQDTIAKATGCSRRTVIRATKMLAARGCIEVEKERRPDCKWLCNVYRVREWNPHKRSGVLGVLEAIRASRQASCHTEGTAKPSRAQPPPVTSFLDEQLKDQRCGRARGAQINRRSCVCEDCGRLLEENKQLLAHLHDGSCPNCQDLQVKYAVLDDERCGLIATVRTQAASLAAKERELTKVRSSDPMSKDIEFVLTRWKRLCGHPKARCPVDGKAWKAVKKALGPWDYSMMEVLEVVEGLALAPYDAGYGKRKVAGSAKERKDDLAYGLRDEENIQKFRDIAHRARGATYEQLNSAHIALLSTEAIYLQLMIEACNRRDADSLLIARAWHYSVGEEAPMRAEQREAA